MSLTKKPIEVVFQEKLTSNKNNHALFLQNIFANTKSIYEAMNVQECKETIRLRLCFIMIILLY